MNRHRYEPLEGDVGTWCGYSGTGLTCGLSKSAEVHQNPSTVTENQDLVSAGKDPATVPTEELAAQGDGQDGVAGDDLICPFCNDNDFDAVGLKSHLSFGRCDVFEATELAARPPW